MEIDFKNVEQSFKKIGFKSANDCPERDPKTVEVYMFENDDWKEIKDCWKKIHTFDLAFDN